MQIFDIGGSGVKTVNLTSHEGIESLDGQEVAFFPKPDWANFAEWANELGLLESDLIGIACAGFIENNQNVKLFRVGRWVDKPLAKEIIDLSPSSSVYILNDAEAHLTAHAGMYDSPCMSISLGTSLGFSIGDKTGKIIRPPDNVNFDVGELSIPTRASNNKAWWAVGSGGLSELEKDLGEEQGKIQFGYRLGAFLAGMCSIFRPKTVVLSGGITHNAWDKFEPTMRSEFAIQKPDWLKTPQISRSPYSRNAALIGIAKYATVLDGSAT
ncbi:MAG: ROK family protein [Acidobacteria bacterium]|nr:ROK family protein [Acidobacteriota bacterium]